MPWNVIFFPHKWGYSHGTQINWYNTKNSGMARIWVSFLHPWKKNNSIVVVHYWQAGFLKHTRYWSNSYWSQDTERSQREPRWASNSHTTGFNASKASLKVIQHHIHLLVPVSPQKRKCAFRSTDFQKVNRCKFHMSLWRISTLWETNQTATSPDAVSRSM